MWLLPRNSAWLVIWEVQSLCAETAVSHQCPLLSFSPPSTVSAKLLILLVGTGMQSEVISVGPGFLGVLIWLPPTLCRR